MTDLELARAALTRLGVVGVDRMPDDQVANGISVVVGALASFTSSLATVVAAIGVEHGARHRQVEAGGIAALLRACADTIETGTAGGEIEQIIAALAEEVRVGG